MLELQWAMPMPLLQKSRKFFLHNFRSKTNNKSIDIVSIRIDGGSDSSWNSDVERFSIAASSDDNESECEQTLKCNETLNESPEHDDDDDEEDAAR